VFAICSVGTARADVSAEETVAPEELVCRIHGAPCTLPSQCCSGACSKACGNGIVRCC
jgi:hypothetical protein